MSETDFDRMRAAMVSNQLRTNAVTDSAVLAVMGSVPRERFAPADRASVVYRDTIVPLGEGRGLNPPIATGRLLDAAAPKVGETALVVGAATGYVAALLAAMGLWVTALEEAPALVSAAHLSLEGVAGVVMAEGPLAAGWRASAPYALIYVDGAAAELPDTLIDQLAETGRLVGAIDDRGVSRLAIGRKAADRFGMAAFADVEMLPLAGFAPAPAFIF